MTKQLKKQVRFEKSIRRLPLQCQTPDALKDLTEQLWKTGIVRSVYGPKPVYRMVRRAFNMEMAQCVQDMYDMERDSTAGATMREINTYGGRSKASSDGIYLVDLGFAKVVGKRGKDRLYKLTKQGRLLYRQLIRAPSYFVYINLGQKHVVGVSKEQIALQSAMGRRGGFGRIIAGKDLSGIRWIR